MPPYTRLLAISMATALKDEYCLGSRFWLGYSEPMVTVILSVPKNLHHNTLLSTQIKFDLQLL